MRERKRERERASLCRVSLFLCSVGVECTTAPTPPPPPPHTHTHHPSSQCSVDCMTDILSPPHTHTQRHRSASQSCVDCTTVLPVCVQRPAVSTFQRTAPSISGNPCTDSAHEMSSTAAPGPMTGLSIWTALTAGHRPWSAKHSDNCCEIHSHAEIPDETDTEILVGF